MDRALGNSSQRYGWVAIALHWVMAALLVGLFALGRYMVELDYYDPWYHPAPWWHKGTGILVLGLWILRLGWRWWNPLPQPANTLAVWEAKLSQLVHRLFYVLIIVIIASGYLLSSGEGQGIDVFGWFEVPALVSRGEGQTELFADVHEFSTTTLAVLVLLHVAAALKHTWLDHDGILVRIIKPGTSRKIL